MKKCSAFLLTVVFAVVLFFNAYADNARETPVVKVVKDNSGAIVSISTEKIVLLQENPLWGAYGNNIDSLFRQFYGAYPPVHALKLKSVGSGVILDKEGIIVTNAHVVNMTTNIFVILNDGTQVKGEIKYESTDSDLAIVKIDPPRPLKEVRIGQTNDLMIGETAIAIGNPWGLENSVSAGVISGKNRTLYAQNGQPVLSGLIQTDTPINPGNSGGALLNLNGELIGINTAMVQNSQGIGFAIPVEKVKEVLENYRENKNVAIKYQGKTAPAQTPYQGISSSAQENENWNPEAEINAMREKMNRIMQNAMSHSSSMQNRGVFNNNISYSNVKLDMKETKDAYVLTLDIKGLDKNKIDIEVNQNSITISDQRSDQNEQKNAGAYFNSSSMSSFSQTISMPQDVNPQAVTTKIKGDSLLITLPKKIVTGTNFQKGN
jgi:S1-C subfamily serine protease/HSP20 family molecular chaperone IbpA